MSARTVVADHPDIDLASFAELGDELLPRLDALREADPLYWSEANTCWIATGHDVVAEGVAGRVPLSAKRRELIASYFPDPAERTGRIGYLLHIFSLFVISQDAPEHVRLRRLPTAAFSRPVAERFRRFVRACVADAMAELEGRR